MKAGKPVYIEKPIALNSASCRRMLEASETLGIPASVAHYRRGLDLFRRAKQLVNEGAIGKPTLVQLNLLHPAKPTNSHENWRVDPNISGGGLFFDLAPHQLDIIYWIFGKPLSFTGTSVNQGVYYDAPGCDVAGDGAARQCILPGIVVIQCRVSHNARTAAGLLEKRDRYHVPFFMSFTSALLEITKGDRDNN
ncbi:MAG: Gfo/Idh/MocA family oxidoreductase [Chryseolinea sp.]